MILMANVVMTTWAKIDCDRTCNPNKPQFAHKPLMPLDANDWIGFSLALLGILLAAGGGIGGGGMLVPIYILVMQFLPKEAVPLSNATILGGSVANCALNVVKRQANVDRPLIDFDIVNVMEPMTIAGAVLGSLINKVLPGWVLTILLMIVLGLITHNCYGKGVKRWKKEDKEKAQDAQNASKTAADDAATSAADGSYHNNQVPNEQDSLSADGNKKTYGTETTIAVEMKKAGEKEPLLNVPSYPKWDAINKYFLCEKTVDEAGKAEKAKAEKAAEDKKVEDEVARVATINKEGTGNLEKVKKIQQDESSMLTGSSLFKFSILCFCWVGVNLLDLMRGGGDWNGPLDVKCGSTGCPKCIQNSCR
jgi:hypothetical protein